MRTNALAALFLSISLAACGGANASGGDPTMGVDEAGGSEVLAIEEADAEADADVKADKPGLTAEQQAIVLQAIDDDCGDTWCEGDFNYRFKRLNCDFSARRCTISVDVITREETPREFPRACRMTGLRGFGSLAYDDGGYWELKQRFFDKVSVCIDKWTPTIPE